MEIARFKFRPHLLTFIFVIVLFGTASFFLTRETIRGGHSIRLFYSIVVDPPNSNWILGAMAVFSVLFTLLGFLGVYRRFAHANDELIFFDDHVEFPASPLRKAITVYYNQIQSMQEYRINGSLIYEVRLNTSKKVGMSVAMFDSKSEYQRATETLQTLVASLNENTR